MSDSFIMLVDADVTPDEAEGVSRRAVDRLRSLGLIAGELTSDCVLDGVGFRPGPAIPRVYEPGEQEGRFWELLTCGVQPRIGRGFNYWALGWGSDGLGCPSCNSEIEQSAGSFGNEIGTAIEQWLNQSGPGKVRCPNCGEERPITEWRCKPPLGFGNLAFSFWNWPPFSLPSWKIDIVDVFRRSTGHQIVQTYGHI